jgi:uncharacterized protein (DUF1800 family)
LHRRAGFAATWDELQRDLAEGPEASIGRLLRGQARSRPAADADAAVDDFERLSTLLADAAVASGEPGRLKAWWIYRMLFSPDPLGERLTLLWHDHFATSNLKVDDLGAMRRQNDTFRRLARAPFGTLLNAAVHDPSLLAWLDAPANRKGHPNENLARELLELFTVGLGGFDEADVEEAARALTGWTVDDAGAFRAVAGRHDDGAKSILGCTGRWTGDDLVRIVSEHPATADRLARRIIGLFFGENPPAADAANALASGLRERGLDVGWATATVLRSEAFFADSNVRSRVVGPVECVVAPVRALELREPPPSTLLLAEWCERLGQELFYPPNVGGWPGGRSWLSTRGLIGRANYAAALIGGRGIGHSSPLDPLALAARHGRGTGRDEVIGFAADLLLGGPPDAAWHDRIAAELRPGPAWGPAAARRAVALVLACPEAMIG